jgi:hypothetical protein
LCVSVPLHIQDSYVGMDGGCVCEYGFRNECLEVVGMDLQSMVCTAGMDGCTEYIAMNVGPV